MIEPILSRLDKVRKTGKGYSARCPAHEDKTASLSLTEKDGKVLMYCFAGCPTASVLGAIGLELADLFDRSEAKPMRSYDRDIAMFSMLRRNPGFLRDLQVMKAGLGMIKNNKKLTDEDYKHLQACIDRLTGFAAIFQERK